MLFPEDMYIRESHNDSCRRLMLNRLTDTSGYMYKIIIVRLNILIPYFSWYIFVDKNVILGVCGLSLIEGLQENHSCALCRKSFKNIIYISRKDHLVCIHLT